MIQLEDLNIRLPGFSVTGVNLLIEPGEFFALIGPTGAGKTLILEAIGGIVPVTRGRILVDGRDVTRLPPERRNVGIVYQDCALFPHLSVHQNIVYGLRYHWKNDERLQTVLQSLMNLLNLDHLMHRFPEHLSGGEKQRVALARALCVQPSVLLLDEPLSALDPVFRDDIRRLLKSIHQKFGITFFMVTHDFSQLTFLADRAAIVDQGTILQQGTVNELFQRPVNRFVAQFVGMKNVFPAQFDGLRATVDGLEIRFDGAEGSSPNHVAIRPEDITLATPTSSPTEVNSFEGSVTGIMDEGAYCEVSVATGDLTFAVVTTKSTIMRLRLDSGDSVRLGIPPSSVHVF